MFGMTNRTLERILQLENQHSTYRSHCLNLIVSENVASPSVRRRLSSDFECRYGNAYAPTLSTDWEAFAKVRWYEGLQYVENVEKICNTLLRQLFDAKYADYRPLSGSSAILANWLSLTEPGDTIVTTRDYDGGHGSGWDDCATILGRKVTHWPFDSNEFRIDVDKAERMIRRTKPKLLVFGASQILFPAPISELKSVADDVSAYCVYDGSHVMGLLAGKRLQDPLREGAIALFGSTHKTFPGPQGGLIVSNAQHEILEKLDRTLSPTLFDNYHQHRVAALAVASAEMIAFGQAYADQIIRNAKALGQALNEEGFTVVGSHKGFTQTHQVLLDVRPLKRDGRELAKVLASCNIITNQIHLPGDPSEDRFGGVRLGTAEVTRTGMKENEMKTVASLFRLCLIDRRGTGHVKRQVIKFKARFNRLKYSFDEGLPAY